MDCRTASWRAAGRSDRRPLSSPATPADAAHKIERRARPERCRGVSAARTGGVAERRRGDVEGNLEACVETQGDGLKAVPCSIAELQATAFRPCLTHQRKTTPTAARQKWNCPGALTSMTGRLVRKSSNARRYLTSPRRPT